MERPALFGALRRAGGPEPLTCCCFTTPTTAWSAHPKRWRGSISTASTAVLAFGEALRRGLSPPRLGRRVFTWHEAADLALFRPARSSRGARDLVWIGNWGDDERGAELREFLVEPVAELGLSARVHGVRYPAEARTALTARRHRLCGYLPNFGSRESFAAAA